MRVSLLSSALLFLVACSTPASTDTSVNAAVGEDLADVDADGDRFLSGYDCDDSDAAVNAYATEVCDGIDNNCDGVIDEPAASDASTWYADVDADGFGDARSTTIGCAAPRGYVADATDCDDDAAEVNPGATEACGGADEDCDGAIDELGARGEHAWYADIDGDGFGDPASEVVSCEAPYATITDGSDCDDTDVDVFPGAVELCDERPNDCATADIWTGADEAGVVSYVATDGVWADVTSSFSAATAATYSLASSGTYAFCPGTWYTKLVGANDSVTILGVYGADVTTIENNSGAGSVLSLNQGAVAVRGLTLTGGSGTSGYGGAIFAVWSGAVPTAPSLTVDACVLTGNTAGQYGGGLATYGAAWVEIANSVITDNTAVLGGGVAVGDDATVIVSDTRISDNLATTTALGGADGGGLWIGDASVGMDTCEVSDNEAVGFGGGVSIQGGSLTMVDSEISGNVASLLGAVYGYGGGFYIWQDGVVDLLCDVTRTDELDGVWGNTAEDGGGVAISANGGWLTSTRCNFGDAVENDPNDVDLAMRSYSSFDEVDETLECDDASCAGAAPSHY